MRRSSLLTWCSRNGSTTLLISSVCLLLVCTSSTHAQYRFQSWTIDNGLPQNTVRSIVQTQDGYLWLATNDGLSRFDGISFVNFYSTNSPGFCCNRLTGLFEDREGTLWIATDDSTLIRYSGGRFETYKTYTNKVRVYGNRIQQDQQGNLVLSTSSGLLIGQPGNFKEANALSEHYYLDRSNTLWYETPGFLWSLKDGKENSFTLPKGVTPTFFYEDRNSTLWVGAFGGLIRIQNGVLTFFDAREGLSATSVNTIIEDRQGILWIGTDKGLYRFVGEKFEEFSTEDGLSSNSIASLYLDREGTLWIGTTDQGLNKLVPTQITVVGTDENTYPVFEDRAGKIWIGTWTNGLVSYSDSNFAKPANREKPFIDKPLSFAEDREGRLWIGSYSTVTWYKDGTFHDVRDQLPKEATSVHAILQDRQGVMWFGTDHGLVKLDQGQATLYLRKDGLAGDEIKVLLEDRKEGIWIGTKDGLTHLNGDRFTSFTRKDGLGSDHIRELIQSTDGTIWIGTFDGGLSRMKDGRITTTYTVKDGLFAKGVFRILDDDRGNFWMTSNVGIYRVSKQQLEDFASGKINSITSVSYGRREGMLNAECNGGSQPAGVRTKGGKLLIPTQNGVAVIDLNQVQINELPPKIVVESIRVNGTVLEQSRTIQLPYDAQNLEIQYVGLSSIHPESIRYRYQLEGVDSGWVEAGTRRLAIYSRLQPGRHKFILSAANSDGVWSNPEERFELIVAEPFWMSWWFVLPSALAVLGILYTFYRIYILKFERDIAKQQAISRQLIEFQENERRRIARDLHDDVVQKVVSLGVSTFNLKTHLSVTDPELDNQLMGLHDRTMGLADDIRKLSHSLHPSALQYVGLVQAVQSLCDELEDSGAITISLVVDEGLETFNREIDLCLYRIVQQALSNVIRHAEAGSVLVSLMRSGGNVELIVSDDGRGFNLEKAKGGIGLISLEERVSALRGKFSINSQNGSGTEIIVVIPLETLE